MVDKAVFGFYHRARPSSTTPPESPPEQAVALPASEPPRELSRPEPIEPRQKFGAGPEADRLEPASVPSVPAAAPEFPRYAAAARTVFKEPPAPPDLSWAGPGSMTARPDADQLGLAHPDVITLVARLPGSHSVGLVASESGIYRPDEVRAPPRSDLPADRLSVARTGFAAGTRILTARGEIEVERLLLGDAALALRGPALLPIVWIGKTINTEPPIWFDAGALGPDLPRRALCLAAEQALFLDPEPVAARTLVNGTSIRRTAAGQVDFFHIDVGKPEVLFAEGVPLASGDRSGTPARP